MAHFGFELSDVETKALSTEVLSIQEWIENVVHERCRIAIDNVVDAEIKRRLDAGVPITGSREEIVLSAVFTK